MKLFFKGPAAHWWYQRLSALPLLPLSLWFLGWVLPVVLYAPYTEVIKHLRPVPTLVPLWFFFLLLFYHGFLGLQVVIEDYIPEPWLRDISLSIFKMLSLVSFLIITLCLFKLSLG